VNKDVWIEKDTNITNFLHDTFPTVILFNFLKWHQYLILSFVIIKTKYLH